MSIYTDASLIVTPNAVNTSKLYSLKGDDLDVVRATSATRVNENGLIETVGNNIARLDYTNGSCPSILVEPQRTNLALYSEQFDNVYWIKSTTTITTNSIISPDGIQTAEKAIATSTGSLHTISRNLSSTVGSNTFSVYAKAAELSAIFLFNSTLSSGRLFDISNGTIGATVGTAPTDSSITNMGDGWYRVLITVNTTVALNNWVIYSAINSTNSGYSFTGDNVSGIYIWGAQLEAGSNATSYIPTVASAVTRNADIISKSALTGLSVITEKFDNNATNEIINPTNYTMSDGRIDYVYKNDSIGGLLNDYPGAGVAYSLRQLVTYSNGYEINVVRVRRSSDNTEQDFTANQITGGTLTSFCGVGDGFVTTWYDQSGNGNNAIQTTAVKQPKIVNSGSLILQSGLPTLDYGDLGGLIEMTSIGIKDLPLNDFSFYHVRKTQNIDSSFPSLQFDGSDDLAFFPYVSASDLLGSRIFWRNLGSITEVNSGDISNTNFLFSFNYKKIAQNYKVFRNSNQVINFNTSGVSNGFSNFYLGSNGGLSYGSLMQEFIAYPTNTELTKTGIETEINNYYSLY